MGRPATLLGGSGQTQLPPAEDLSAVLIQDGREILAPYQEATRTNETELLQPGGPNLDPGNLAVVHARL